MRDSTEVGRTVFRYPPGRGVFLLVSLENGLQVSWEFPSPNHLLDRYVARQVKPNTDSGGAGPHFPQTLTARPPDDVAATLSGSTPTSGTCPLGRGVQVEIQLSNAICISLVGG